MTLARPTKAGNLGVHAHDCQPAWEWRALFRSWNSASCGPLSGMQPIYPIPQLLEREYAGFLAITAGAPAKYSLPAAYDGWMTLMAGPRRQRGGLGNDAREIPVTLSEFKDYCARVHDARPTIATIEKCCTEIASRLFPNAEFG